jgi:dipeptidyl aminopeptidase/acylaminoacyl peptidase
MLGRLSNGSVRQSSVLHALPLLGLFFDVDLIFLYAMHRCFPGLFLVVYLCISTAALAQQPALTVQDYARAERFMGYNTSLLIDRNMSAPTWLPGDRFWYRVLTPQGSEFVVVDPARKTKTAAFDPVKLAAALGTASGKSYEAARLPFRTFTFSPDEQQVLFSSGGKNWRYEVASGRVSASPTPALSPSSAASAKNEVESPDGRRVAFLRDYNLWVRDTQTKAETPLTTDGVKDYGYATDNAGYATTDKPVLLWSPDSRKIATFRQDHRAVSDMYLVTTNVGRPTLKTWKYPFVGDKDVIRIERVILEVEHPKVVKLQLAPDPRRSTGCPDLSCEGKGLGDAAWNADATQLAFVSVARDAKQVSFRVADAATGSVRDVFSETVATYFESGRFLSNWRYLSNSQEVLWYSARDNWGHLYLYDAITGKLKHQITKGNWAVRELVRVDEKARQLYFLAGGREPGNPYFTYLYRIGLDGKHLTLLTPEAGNHVVTFAPSGRYFVDSYSQHDVPPISLLRTADGKLVLPLGKTDISRLLATGWKPPTPITTKAQDGQIDLYGLMYTPTALDPTKKYPVINCIYPGPQYGSVSQGGWSFTAARVDHQALAELGFVVVLIEGSCNPYRSKRFQDACYGNLIENTLSDQVTGLRQLAERYPYLDLNRVGVWGHSGGGYAAAAALFRYPDFYKVGISESGNHDMRNYKDAWGEKYVGLLTSQADGTSNYSSQANAAFAKNLKGKLLLAHGLLDNNVPPTNTMLVAEALIKANKTFDLVLFPQAQHAYGPDAPYMTRRRWDYFVQNLAGALPPHDYEMKPITDPRDAVQ